MKDRPAILIVGTVRFEGVVPHISGWGFSCAHLGELVPCVSEDEAFGWPIRDLVAIEQILGPGPTLPSG